MIGQFEKLIFNREQAFFKPIECHQCFKTGRRSNRARNQTNSDKGRNEAPRKAKVHCSKTGRS